MPSASLQRSPLARDLPPLLRTAWIGQPLEAHTRIGSTNERAAAWADAGAQAGSVVVADFQSRGRGRLGRRWKSAAGKNLTFSVVLRPQLSTDEYGRLVMAAALAVCEAVEPLVAPLAARIRWPNDLLVEGRKCCGILLETASAGPAAPASQPVVLGIGLNVNQAHFPDGLRTPATSLLLATGRFVPRAPLLADVLYALERRLDLLAAAGAEAVRDAYRQRLVGLGEVLTVHLGRSGRQVRGGLVGVTTNGALRLSTADGIVTLAAGEVAAAGLPSHP